jgi:hypothetical protein
LSIKRGVERDPIVEVMVVESVESVGEGWEVVDGGAINELGPERWLAVRRAPVSDTGSYLVRLSVTSNNPLTLIGTYRSYTDLLTTDVTPEDRQKRDNRRYSLRRTAWNLFRSMIYSAAVKAENVSEESMNVKIEWLQERFVRMLCDEARFTGGGSATERSYESMRLPKVCTGHLWLASSQIRTGDTGKPQAAWLDLFHRETSTAESSGIKLDPAVHSFKQLSSLFWANQEGVLPRDQFELISANFEISPVDLDAVSDRIFNESSEADFFIFLSSFREKLLSTLDDKPTLDWLRSSQCFGALPHNYQLATDYFQSTPSESDTLRALINIPKTSVLYRL